MSHALKPCYDELLDALPNANTLNIDETGHKENGDRFWTWCFRAEMYTLFRIDKSRGSQVLIDVLGEEFGFIRLKRILVWQTCVFRTKERSSGEVL